MIIDRPKSMPMDERCKIIEEGKKNGRCYLCRPRVDDKPGKIRDNRIRALNRARARV